MKRSFGLKKILVFMLVVGGLFFSLSSPVFADTRLVSSTSYQECINAGYTDHGFGKNSSTSYWGMDIGESGHNCTNYASYMMIRAGATLPGNVRLGNPAGWPNVVRSYNPSLVNNSPAPGAVAQWNYGHVAYVERLNSDGSITISEDNWNGPFSWRTISAGSSDWPNNFIHFKDIEAINTPVNNVSKTLLSNFVTSDGICHVISGTANGSVYETWFGTGSVSTSQIR